MKSRVLVIFGRNVRRERLKLYLSQEELGELAGLHRTYIGMIERAEKNVTLQNIERIAKALKVPIHSLFG
jgi:transcriptional regulator with XRE-family HTH domain